MPNDKLFVFLALLAFFLLCTFSIANKYTTIDESLYIAAGYSYLKTLDFRVNPEHPVLGKMLLALPLILLNPELPLGSENWKKLEHAIDIGANYRFASDFWKLNLKDFRNILLASRLVAIVASLLIALLLFFWLREYFGSKAAFFALLLYIFGPNIIAHSRLATLDILLSLFFFATFYFLWKFLESTRVKFIVASSFCFALAILTKYSALAMLAILPLFVFLYARINRKCFSLNTRGKLAFLLYVLLPFAFMHVIYAFDSSASGLKFLFPSRVYDGFTFISKWVAAGREGYLLGSFSRYMPHYFVACMLFKSTLAMLVLFVVSFFILKKDRKALLFLFPGLAFFLLVSFTSKFYLGYRYVMPALPFFLGFIGIAYSKVSQAMQKAFVILLALHALSSLLAFPHYISYFNELATLAGKEHLLSDSNIDWGQDIFYFLDYIKKHNVKEPYFAYFAWPDPNLFTKVHYAKICKPRSIKIFVSVTRLIGFSESDNCLRWLLNYKPKAVIGGSIYYYEIK